MRRHYVLVVVIALIGGACSDDSPVTTTTAATTTPGANVTATTTSTTSTTTTTTIPPTTTTAAVTTTAEPLPVNPAFALLLDGLAEFGNLGDPAEPMIAAFLDEFGEPAADSDWIEEHGCAFEGAMRTITWIDPGIRVVFVDGISDLGEGEHFSSYTTLQLGFDAVPTPWTMFGVERGTNLADIGDLFPDAELIPGPGLDYIHFDPTVLSYAWVDGSGAIVDFWAGINFCGRD